MVMGIENLVMNIGRVLSLLGNIKLNSDYSFFKLFCIGEFDRIMW